MKSFKATGQSQIMRAAFSRSGLLLLLFLLIAPQAMAATAASCQAGATITVNGTISQFIQDSAGTWMYIDTPAWDCATVYILVKDAKNCGPDSTIQASGTLAQPDPQGQFAGWSLSDSGKGAPYTSSYSCK